MAIFAIDASAPGAFATNGYGTLSPGGYALAAVLVCEVVLTAMFLVIIMGATHGRAPAGFAPIAVGLGLTLIIHLISIPVTSTSVNPARSTGVALFVQNGTLGQLWLFWLAPLLGGALGGALYRWMTPSSVHRWWAKAEAHRFGRGEPALHTVLGVDDGVGLVYTPSS